MKNNFIYIIWKKEVFYKELSNNYIILFYKKRISDFRNKIEHEICFDLSNVFLKRKQHVVDVSYEDNFSENQIPTKARPFQMNAELEQHCRLEIQDLKSKGLI